MVLETGHGGLVRPIFAIGSLRSTRFRSLANPAWQEAVRWRTLETSRTVHAWVVVPRRTCGARRSTIGTARVATPTVRSGGDDAIASEHGTGVAAVGVAAPLKKEVAGKGRPVSFQNHSTGETFEDEDDYLRSIKLDDSYSFAYDYEYVADRFGDGDDDVRLENARLNVTLSWDDSSAPGYVVAYTVDSPTPIPND